MFNALELDLMVRAAALSLLALLAAILCRDHRHTLPGQLALLLLFGAACHLIAEMPGREQLDSASDWIISIGECSFFGSFWLFARAWFNDETRIGSRSLLIVALAMALSLSNMFQFRSTGQNYWPVDLLMRLTWLALAGAGLWAAWRGRNTDLIEARRRLRTGFVWMTGLATIAITLIFLFYNQVGRIRTPLTVEIGISTLILIVASALSFTLFGFRQTDLFASITPIHPIEDRIDDPASDALAQRLHLHMAHERAYRDEKLTIAGLAAQLGEQEYRLRRLINGRLGHRNFAAFLNGYRLDEVRQALGEAEQNQVPILTIALDAGFGSLAPFNRAFRDAEGITPSVFRQRATANSVINSGIDRSISDIAEHPAQ
jgi:AraC-like DNA-binding protein